MGENSDFTFWYTRYIQHVDHRKSHHTNDKYLTKRRDQGQVAHFYFWALNHTLGMTEAFHKQTVSTPIHPTRVITKN